jgi:uncharacterized protein (DUF433 family)
MRILTHNQIDDIQRRLDSGMSPDAIAHHYGRVADLDLADVASIRDHVSTQKRGLCLGTSCELTSS